MHKFLNIIPKSINPLQKQSPKHFTRDSKFTFSRLLTFILSITASGKGKGVDVKSGDFFRNARRSGLWPAMEPAHRSTLSKARSKIDWQIFRDILAEAVDVANAIWPKLPHYLWHGMSVYAIDGSKYTLPATVEIRKEFDPKSGLQYSGKGHFPQCLVSTAYDVFRRLPIARTVVSVNASEREQAKDLGASIPSGSVLLFDRGYPSYEFILFLCQSFSGHFVFRCPATSTFPAVESFVKSGKEEDIIWIDPSNKYLSRANAKQRQKLETIKLRVIRLVAPDGKVSVLLTNLYNRKMFTRSEIIDLYFRRWEIEGHYRDEKIVLEVEVFHGRTCNSIRQELFAASIMTVISRTLMVAPFEVLGSETKEFQFKNTIMTLASEAAVLTSDDPEKAIAIFREIIKELARVKYYRPKVPRPAQPRVTKKNLNKWAQAKIKKVANA
ncbi:MAG: IS4 family transposase [Pseudomonadota bacterium]